MAETRKVLGQSAPVAATLTDLYPVPAVTQAVVSSIVICNRSAVATAFRISVAVNGAADATSQYIYYDVPIFGNDTFIATIGITLGDTDVVRCYATLATVTFTAFGVEIT